MVRISLVPTLVLMVFYVSSFWRMCAVPNMAVFCSFRTSWLPGMLPMYFRNDFEMVPVAPVITGITVVFTFHIRWISIVRSLYFKMFSASFLITLLSAEMATSISTHVLFSLSRIIISGCSYLLIPQYGDLSPLSCFYWFGHIISIIIVIIILKTFWRIMLHQLILKINATFCLVRLVPIYQYRGRHIKECNLVSGMFFEFPSFILKTWPERAMYTYQLYLYCGKYVLLLIRLCRRWVLNLYTLRWLRKTRYTIIPPSGHKKGNMKNCDPCTSTRLCFVKENLQFCSSGFRYWIPLIWKFLVAWGLRNFVC